jgi:Ca-activated chloride channel homolog
VQRLLRGRERRHFALAALLVVLAVAGAGARGAAAGAEEPAISIEITSPLGRSGLPGKVRIVARVTAPAGPAAAAEVRFFVDGALVGIDTDGPPYAVDWEDSHPYEQTTLAAEAHDARYGVVRTELALPPFDYTDETSVLSVGVEASVRDPRGRSVHGLDARDFLLFEDGQPQSLDSLTSEAAPATFALLIDASASMRGNIGFLQQAAGLLTAHLRDIDQVVVAPFRNGITSVTGPTRDHATIQDAVAAVSAVGGTAILDALRDVTLNFGDGPGRRVAVLITDGYDEQSQGEPDEILDALRASRVTVYVISIGGVAGISLKGERLLRRIATETGGRAFFPWDARQLRDAHFLIADDVRHQYRLTYTPSNQTADGTWRSIRVATSDPAHLIVARTGYRAPAPAPVRASLEFTATDDRLQYVDLTSAELEVLEDGVPQHVDLFAEAVAPVSIVLALDASGSMRRSVEVAREAAHGFVRTLRPEDPLGVLLFADHVSIAHDLSTVREMSHDAIESYSAGGGTALNDALADAAHSLQRVRGRRVIVLMTDGRDENASSDGPGSHRSWAEATETIANSEATVYIIGLGARVDRTRLEELAALSGGEAYFPSEASELQQHYDRILQELRRRYVVGYTSTNSSRDGAWRRVEIRAANPAVRIRSRGGYVAPGP